MHKKVASIVTTAVLLVTISTTAVIASPASDKLNQQQNQMQEHKNQYRDAQSKVQAIENQIENFDGQIEKLMMEVNDNKTKIKSIQNDIEASENEIKKAEEDIKQEQDLYNERMKVMYMNGVGGYLDVILGADNLGDLFQRVEAVKKITDLDKKIVKELEEKQNSIKAKEKKLKAEQDKLVALNKSQEEKAKKLEEDRKAQDKLVQEARRQAVEFAGALKDDQAKINETEKLIQQIRNKAPKYTASKGSTSSSTSTGSSSPSRGSKPSRGSAPISSDSVVAYASNFLGTPYVWGANGPDNFDCSGFTKYVYAHFGVNLPRVSGDQAQTGEYVSRGNLQPGDLVFFGSPVHHVGIYVGNGSYIHAPRTGDVVKISTLSGRSDYSSARRVR